MNKLFCCLLLLIFNLQIGYTKGVKYGKISKEEILLKECSFETSASAVILSKSCKINIDFNKIRYMHHVRIKILDEKALDEANIELSYYSKKKLESISSVKAQTINFDVNGKKIVSELSSKAIFKTDLDENYGAVRFTLPNVKVGSIIEYKYTLNSNFYSYLDTWYFQSNLPTIKSYLKVDIPEYFRYDLVMFGNRIKTKYTGKTTNEWELDYLSSVQSEPYVNNCYDYIEQMRFQLVGYYKKSSGGSPEFVTANKKWDELALEYLNGIFSYKRKAIVKKLLPEILNGDENQWVKVQKIHDYVASNIVWNGKYGVYPDKSTVGLLEKKSGNKASINLLLFLLLQEAGIKSDLALSKTNTSGLLQTDYPLMSQFNNPIVYVEIYKKKFFVDGSSPYRPYDLLSEKDLNYHAFVLDKKNFRWEKIKASDSSIQIINTVYDFRNIDQAILKCNVSEKGYYAEETRKSLHGGNQKSSVLSTYLSIDDDLLIQDSIEMKNLNNVNKKIELSIEQPIGEVLNLDDQIVYFSPFAEASGKNPFLAEERQFRIDFNYPFAKMQNIRILIPEGYVFDNNVCNKVVKLPNNYGLFTYKQTQKDRELNIRVVHKINVPSVSKNYYSALKQFYSIASEMLNKQIIIKKQ